MIVFDAHLDLAWNAIDWNRDLKLPVADIRRRVAHVAGLDTPLFGPRDDSPGLFQEAAP